MLNYKRRSLQGCDYFHGRTIKEYDMLTTIIWSSILVALYLVVSGAIFWGVHLMRDTIGEFQDEPGKRFRLAFSWPIWLPLGLLARLLTWSSEKLSEFVQSSKGYDV